MAVVTIKWTMDQKVRMSRHLFSTRLESLDILDFYIPSPNAASVINMRQPADGYLHHISPMTSQPRCYPSRAKFCSTVF